MAQLMVVDQLPQRRGKASCIFRFHPQPRLFRQLAQLTGCRGAGHYRPAAGQDPQWF